MNSAAETLNTFLDTNKMKAPASETHLSHPACKGDLFVLGFGFLYCTATPAQFIGS